jgi:hypothetical protein
LDEISSVESLLFHSGHERQRIINAFSTSRMK